MSKNVRVRFAPSPTGPLHMGGIRTALFNYLFAKKHGGTFVLRIEDTDQGRYVENAEQYIIDALEWCNIPFDEGPNKNEKFGPYRQSERKEIYAKYATELIEKGWAYYAFDAAEELDRHRKEHEENKKTFIYNWHNRLKLNNSLSLSAEEVQSKLDSGEKYVIRFKTPQDETLILKDEIRGTVKVETKVLDDKILCKSDGMPTYHLANIVDDHLMEISHVIRGEEWLPSLALHSLLYTAFGWEAPKFAHLPLILKPVGKGKLSKRDGDKLGFPVFPLEYTNKEGEVSRGYKEDGYFPESFINLLAFLGWNPGTEEEIFDLEKLISEFDLSRVNKAGAKFSPDKAKWYNQQWLQKKSVEEVAELFTPILVSKGINSDKVYTEKVVEMVKERASFVNDLFDLSYFFFESPASYDEKNLKKCWKEGTEELLNKVVTIIENTVEFTVAELHKGIKGWITDNEIGFGKVMQPLRLSLVGKLAGPDVFDIMLMIGKEETILRIKKAIKTPK